MTDSTDNARGPERIWWNAAPMPHSYTSTVQFAGGTEYIRADLAPDALDDPRVVALVSAVREVAQDAYGYDDLYETTFHRDVHQKLSDALAALSPTGGNDE